MVDKVLQENKRIANLAAKQVSENPSVNLRKGFVPPSIYKGKTLMDTMEAFQEKTGIPATQYLRYRGRPMIGKQGGDKSLELINKVVDPKDRYTKIGAGQRAAEELITGPVKTMKNKPIRQSLSNFFETVQKKADDVFGAAQDIAGDIAKQEDKLKFITKEIAEKFPSIAAKGVDFVRRIGFAMLFGGPSTLGADLIPESVLNDMAQDLGVMEKEPMTFRDGGIASINDIIKPVGV